MSSPTFKWMLPLAFGILIAFPPSRGIAGGVGRASQQVFPNPFTDRTTFQLTMPTGARIRVAVYDMLGRLVATLLEGGVDPGNYEVSWDGKDLSGNVVPPGVYVCMLYSNEVAVNSAKVMKLSP